jgi:plastocyanin
MTKPSNVVPTVSRRGFLTYCATATTLLASGSAFAELAPSEPAPSAPAPSEPVPPPVELPRGTLKGVVSTTPTQTRQHAIVYIENAPLEKVIDTTLDDVKLTFVPHVSVMTAGGTLNYVNRHPFPDSAFSGSNEKFDFGVVEANGRRKRKFENAGIYTLLCHIHPNQVGFLVVTPSSYFARVDKQGNFEIPNVPAGNYEVVAWAPRLKLQRQNVTIVSGAEAVLAFELSKK